VRREPDESWIVWCGLNDEGRRLAEELSSDAVLIEGSHSEHEKVERYHKWREGAARVLITKPSMFGWGMNWQHCARVAFLGLSDSYESYYQAVRRCWRFGQERPVRVSIVTSDAETHVVANVLRKARDAEHAASRVIEHMSVFERAEIAKASSVTDHYIPSQRMELPSWLTS
jgi:superfamily II DNA helicase RecQ